MMDSDVQNELYDARSYARTSSNEAFVILGIAFIKVLARFFDRLIQEMSRHR